MAGRFYSEPNLGGMANPDVEPWELIRLRLLGAVSVEAHRAAGKEP